MYRRELQHCSGSNAVWSGRVPVLRHCLAVLCCVLGTSYAAPSVSDVIRDGMTSGETPESIELPTGQRPLSTGKNVLGQRLIIDALVTTPVATGEETSQARINEVIAPLIGDSIRQYKSDFGGGDEGPFAGDYKTTFTGPDPNGALIEWLRGAFIQRPTHLLVKDGNSDPAWYLFDITGWDGKSTIELLNFWKGVRGAISHVTIYGPKGPFPPPEPAIAVQKTAGEVVAEQDGSLTVPFEITVTNTGDEPLIALQIEDSLDIFGTGELLAVEQLSSDTLSVNTAYDGLTDINLLDGTDTLAPGDSASVSFTVRFDSGDETGQLLNVTIAAGTGEVSGTTVTDSAQVPFPLPPPQPQPAIEVEKIAGEVIAETDGGLSVPFEITVTNTGDEQLIALQIEDSLDIFGTGALLAVEQLSSAMLRVNPAYDGLTDINLLNGTDTLAVGESASVSFTIRFDPGDEPGPFSNVTTAIATGEGGGTVVSDTDSESFPVIPTIPQPGIEVEKTAGEVIAATDGSLSVPFEITVTNTGDEPLIALQIEDSLDIFGTGALLAVEQLSSATLSVNTAYDGLTDINLLDGADTLAPGESAIVSFTVRFDPGDELGPFLNVTTAMATGQSGGTVVSDTDSEPFSVIPTIPQPAIEVQKTAGEVVAQQNGSLTVPFEITVTNTGNEQLISLQVEDSLDIFGTGELLAVEQLSSATLSVNTDYDGLTDIDLLDGTDTLAPGESASVSFTVRFDPGDESGPFVNVTTAAGTGADSGTTVTDSAQVPFPLPPPQPQPAIEVEKIAGEVTAATDGGLSVPFEITVTNTGDEQLIALQIEDSLDIFGTGALLAVEQLSSAMLRVNPAYDGLTDINLLNGTDTLAVGESASVSFTIRFDPGDELGPFSNVTTAIATGEGGGTVVSDTDSESFPVIPTIPQPAIEVQKTAGEVVAEQDGSLTVPFEITVTNTGDEQLISLQIEDSLDIFGTGELLAVEQLSSATLSLNTAYNGLTDINLLDGTDTLAPGESASVSFTARFDPGDETGPLLNVTIAAGTGEVSGTTVTDSAQAPFPLPPAQPQPAIEVEKAAGEVVAETNGSLTVPFEITVTNTGDEQLIALQIEDSLDIFGTGELLAVEQLSSATLSVNTAYDGLTDINLLDGADTLAPGESAIVSFTVRFDPGDELGPFLNVTTAMATGQSGGTVVSDTDSEPFSVIPTIPQPAIEVQKTAGEVVAQQDGSLTVPFEITVTNTGNEQLISLQVEDSLDIFGTGELLAVEQLSSATLSVNTDYDGLTDIDLLDGTDTLALGESASVSFTARFDPGDEPGPFLNVTTAMATGEGGGTVVSDTDSESFPVIPTVPQPAIEVQKSAGQVVAELDGSLSVPFEIIVTNTGDEGLAALRIEDSLDIFGTGELLAVEQLSSATLSVNTDYDGLTDIDLLDGTDTLAPGESASVSFTVRFDPGDESGPFLNFTTATATSADSSAVVADTDSASFPVIPTVPQPALEVEKTAGQVVAEQDGSRTVPFEITVTNTGDEHLVDLQIEDSLDIFGTGQLLAVEQLFSATLSVNTAYDGLTSINLLDGTDSLAIGESASVSFTVRFDPGDETGPLLNVTIAAGTGENSGTTVTDSAEASFQLPPPQPQPALEVQKTAGQVVAGQDGSLAVPFEITVVNTGDEGLVALQIEDSLDIFGTGGLLAVEQLSSPTLSVNTAYDGMADINLLDGTDTLAPGESAGVSFTVRFDPGDETGPFFNVATAMATGEDGGTVVSDTDSESFPVIPTIPQPGIEVEKTAGEVIAATDGSLSVPFEITVTNTGDEQLVALQIEDSLDIFGTGGLLAVEQLSSPTLSVNTAYDGMADINLLDGTATLAPGESASVSFTIRFDPGDEPGPFSNVTTAIATGEGGGTVVSDTDSESFPVIPTIPQPAIEVQKTAGEVVAEQDGSLTVPFEITIVNTGDEPLIALQIEDSLDIFGTGELLAVEQLSSAMLSVNTTYDGLTDINLLNGTDTLAPGESASVSFTVRFDPGDDSGPFLNETTATATSADSGTVVADTDSASFPVIPTVPQPAIEVQKSAGEVVVQQDGSLTVPFEITVSNAGDEPLAELQLDDSLDIFRTGSLLAIENLAAPGLAVNNEYDGISDIELLEGSDTLPVGEQRIVTLTALFDPAGETEPLQNIVFATARGEISGENVADNDSVTFSRPVQPPPPPAQPDMSVTKSADRKEVVRGDFVGYDVRVTNLSDQSIADIVIADQPPPGFNFVAETALLIRSGDDGSLNTADDVITSIAASGQSPVEFAAFDLEPDEAVLIRYLLQVSTGVADGDYTNNVTVVREMRDSVSANAVVTVVGDPMFEKTTLIGKVFDDRNGNRVQDVSEPGVAGVRLGTVSGLLIETDSAGRFHIADVDVPRFERGANFIIKIDESSLPEGTQVLSDNPQVTRLTQATMSRINFAVRLPGTGEENCLRQCFDVTPRRVQAGIGPVYFSSGETAIPPELGFRLRQELTTFGVEQRARLLFIGHSDNVPVSRALAEELGAYGEAGNVILAGRRARQVCEFVRDRLNVATDCSLVRGRGSADAVASNDTEAGRALNRRVEIAIEYFEFGSVSSPVPVSAAMCLATSPEAGLLNSILSREPRITSSQTVCETGPPQRLTGSSAAAREITISGGRFGCGRLAAEVLPGRGALGGAPGQSAVTVFADSDLNVTPGGTHCTEAWGSDIRSGSYPIEVRTERNSVLWINSAGDVLRQLDPENDERIVVTPFRDDTDSTIITALRIANEGTEPDPGAGEPEDSTSDVFSSYRTVDALIIDPRLDVLALNRPVSASSFEQETLRFAAYTNYRAFIKSYALDVYGLREGGYARELLDSIQSDEAGFGTTIDFRYRPGDLAPYRKLEYVLRAIGCAGDTANESCYSDETAPRAIDILDADSAPAEMRDPAELWGKSNLASQRIPIVGGRIRIDEIASADKKTRKLNGVTVPGGEPVGGRRRFVLEEHLPFSPAGTGPGTVDIDTDSSASPVDADATGVTVSGGLFGCGMEISHSLPGRLNRDDTIETVLTVVADPNATSLRGGTCPDGSIVGEYPIVVSTAESSVILVSEAGDVIREQHPEGSISAQHIVVSPFRDDSNDSVVSALRIWNEGIVRRAEDSVTVVETIDDSIDEAPEPFVVALANITVGKNNVSGATDLLDADAHYDGSTYTDGRLAVYAKARLKEKYLVTAQLDTTEDELRNLSDNLKRKDPNRVFRQLDANRHYPVYGDDSTTTTDVDTQGALYLRVDWDGNRAQWGNYNTGLTDTEFMQYNRSLYGAMFAHSSQGTTRLGDESTELTLFASEPQSLAAHVTFQATGGSLYYLRDTDIVQGSEKVWIEVRRRDTESVVEREILLQGRDYEVDAIQGRIILSRPLAQIVAERSASIIRSTPLEGDDVFLLVDYEYVPAGFDPGNLTFGGRGRAWLGAHLGIGATAVTDERAGTDYQMQGVDITLKKSNKTYLRAELAGSNARQSSANMISFDGGLSFQSQVGADPGIDGEAYAIDARLDLEDFGDSLTGDIHAWQKSRDAGFSTGRLGQGVGVDDSGVESRFLIGDNLEISASYTDLERKQVARERVTRVQAEGVVGKLKAGVELRHEDIELLENSPSDPVSGLNAARGDGSALLLGARLGYAVTEASTIYAAAQSAASADGSYEPNDLVSVGINRWLNDDFTMSVEASDGDRGSAVTAGVDVTTAAGLDFNLSGGVGSGAISQFGTRYAIADGHELYGSYTVDPDRTEAARNLLTLGQRRSFGNSLTLFAESQFGKGDRYANVAHVFGLGFGGEEGWRFAGSVHVGEVGRNGNEFERQAVSLGAALRRSDLRLSSRLELREDEGVGVHSRQYLSSNSFTRKAGDNQRWLGQLNVSWTDDELNGGRDARFVEFELGHAFRPAATDRLNLITRYSFLFDLPSEGQASVRPDEKSHLLAVDGIYEINDLWELGGKLAVRNGERRLIRDAGPWFDFGLKMAAARARYKSATGWEGLLEYRWLADIDDDNARHGALLGVYRKLNDHMKVGIGFNFTDFDDDLRSDGYRSHGWFVDLVGSY